MVRQCTLVNLFQVLSESNFFVGAILILFLITEDSLDLFVKSITTVAHEENLKGLFNGDTALEGLIVHQELNKVEQFAWFKSWGQAVLTGKLLGDDTATVHSDELVLGDVTVQVIIDFPNDESNVVTVWTLSKELEDTSDIHW